MAPESPGNLVVLDLRYDEKGTLFKTVEQVTPPQEEPAHGWLRVRFDEAPDADFYPVGQGVVDVSQPEGYKHCPPGPQSKVLTIGGGPHRYVFDNVALGEGLQLVLVLPKGYTLSEFNPVPTSAKDFRERLAVYFRPKEKYGQTATVTWQLRRFRGSIDAEAKRLRGDFLSARQPQTTGGAFLDREDPDFKEIKSARKSSGKTTPSSEQPMAPWSYAAMALVGLAIGIGLLLFYVYRVPKLVESGVQNQVFYLLLIPWSLGSAAFLFGAMRSYARLTRRHFGSALELGGPVVLFCLVVAGGFKLVPPPPEKPETFDLTVRPYGAEGADTIIASGQITIDLDNDRRSKAIDSNGEADFKGIPAKFRGATVGVLPQVEGFKQEWQRLKIIGDVLDVKLQRAPAPVARLSGSIVPTPKDWASLRILVDGQSTQGKVDERGRFDFEVNGKIGDTIRLKIYDGSKLVCDNYYELPGPLNLAVPCK